MAKIIEKVNIKWYNIYMQEIKKSLLLKGLKRYAI